MRSFECHLFNRVNEVEDKIDQVLQFHTSSSPPALPADDVQVSPILTVQSQHVSGALAEPATQHVLAGLFFSPTETVSQGNIPQENLAIAWLGDEDFPYDKSKLQGPPLIHFSGDIERLCCEWKESNLLTVNGRGIPVKYWGEFFKKSKGRARSVWDSIKVKWSNWKVRQTLPSLSSSWILILPHSLSVYRRGMGMVFGC